jgi:hypothetical protein
MAGVIIPAGAARAEELASVPAPVVEAVVPTVTSAADDVVATPALPVPETDVPAVEAPAVDAPPVEAPPVETPALDATAVEHAVQATVDAVTPPAPAPAQAPEVDEPTSPTTAAPALPALPEPPALPISLPELEDVAYVPRTPLDAAPKRLIAEVDRRLTAIGTTVRDLRRDLDEAQAGVRTSSGGAVRELGNQLEPLTETVRRLNRALDQADPVPAALERPVARLADHLGSARADLSELGRDIAAAGGDPALLHLSSAIGELDQAAGMLDDRGAVMGATREWLVVPERRVSSAPLAQGGARYAPPPANAAEIYATGPPAPRLHRANAAPPGTAAAAGRNGALGGSTGAAGSGSVAPGNANFGASVAALLVLTALALAGISMRLATSPPNWRSVIVVAPLERPG